MAIVEATWEGPFIGEILGVGIVHPGDTVMIPEEQTVSSHFKVTKTGKRARAKVNVEAEAEAA